MIPREGVEKKANWLWAWALAVPAGTQKEEAAKEFMRFVTSADVQTKINAGDALGQLPVNADAAVGAGSFPGISRLLPDSASR